eukprot:1262047-Rhodomonas_salina.1
MASHIVKHNEKDVRRPLSWSPRSTLNSTASSQQHDLVNSEHRTANAEEDGGYYWCDAEMQWPPHIVPPPQRATATASSCPSICTRLSRCELF